MATRKRGDCIQISLRWGCRYRQIDFNFNEAIVDKGRYVFKCPCHRVRHWAAVTSRDNCSERWHGRSPDHKQCDQSNRPMVDQKENPTFGISNITIGRRRVLPKRDASLVLHTACYLSPTIIGMVFMEPTTILLILAVIIIVLLVVALYRRTAHHAMPEDVMKEPPAIQTLSQKRNCPSCQKEISSSAHRCPECQSYVSVCPSCDKDSVFSSVSKDGLKRLKVQSGFSTLGWPLSKIAVCGSCKTPFLLCSYCGTPAPTASNNCPNCGAMLAVGLVPIIKDLGEVIGGIVQGRIKTPGKKVSRK